MQRVVQACQDKQLWICMAAAHRHVLAAVEGARHWYVLQLPTPPGAANTGAATACTRHLHTQLEALERSVAFPGAPQGGNCRGASDLDSGRLRGRRSRVHVHGCHVHGCHVARATLRRRGTASHAQACAGVLPRTLSPAPHDAQSTWSSCGKARPAVRRTRHTCCKALYTTTGGCLLKGSTGHFDLLFEDDMDALGPGCRRHTGVEQRNAFRRNLPPADGSNALTHFSLITSSSHCS